MKEDNTLTLKMGLELLFTTAILASGDTGASETAMDNVLDRAEGLAKKFMFRHQKILTKMADDRKLPRR